MVLVICVVSLFLSPPEPQKSMEYDDTTFETEDNRRNEEIDEEKKRHNHLDLEVSRAYRAAGGSSVNMHKEFLDSKEKIYKQISYDRYVSQQKLFHLRHSQ